MNTELKNTIFAEDTFFGRGGLSLGLQVSFICRGRFFAALALLPPARSSKFLRPCFGWTERRPLLARLRRRPFQCGVFLSCRFGALFFLFFFFWRGAFCGDGLQGNQKGSHFLFVFWGDGFVLFILSRDGKALPWLGICIPTLSQNSESLVWSDPTPLLASGVLGLYTCSPSSDFGLANPLCEDIVAIISFATHGPESQCLSVQGCFLWRWRLGAPLAGAKLHPEAEVTSGAASFTASLPRGIEDKIR